MQGRVIASISIPVSQYRNENCSYTLQHFSGFWTTHNPNNKCDQDISSSSPSSSLQALVFILWKWWHRSRLTDVHDVFNRELRGWHWHGHGSRSLKCATIAGGVEGDGTKQPKWKSGFHNILGMVLPDQFFCFNGTLNPHLSKQNWTTVITNIKSSPYPSQGPKVAWKLFPPKRLDRTWFYRAMCYVLSSFLEIWNRFLTPVTLATVSSTAWADWAHSGN